MEEVNHVLEIDQKGRKKKDKKAHGRMLGIIRLIRELYKLKMLTERTMH